MAATATGVTATLVEAIVARDVEGATALLAEDVDFRAMTPRTFWEAAGAAEVEAILREWFAHPDEEIHGIEATEPVAIRGTTRVGWLVEISDADGRHVFEQQAYVRERDGRIAWMRVICSGFIALD